MTEAEWLTTKLPLYMLRRYPAEWDGRKVRLFWCACMRRAWDQVTDDPTRRLVEEVERHPEADTDWFERERSFAFEGYHNWTTRTHSGLYIDSWAFEAFLGAPPDSLMGLVSWLAHCAGEIAVQVTEFSAGHPLGQRAYQGAETAEKAWQCDLIREIFGNPFRPVSVAPWLTSDVKLLARGIYEEKAFDRMPILADALQDAGCDDVNVLDHCRQPGEHVRGCWVIDRLLGKG